MRKTAIALFVLALSVAQSHPASAGELLDFFNTGCIITGSHSHGCFVTNVKGPGGSGPLARGSREGEACGYNVLALFSWGDVRISTAMRNGGINDISSIDYKAFELIPGFYGFSRFCTVVHGE